MQCFFTQFCLGEWTVKQKHCINSDNLTRMLKTWSHGKKELECLLLHSRLPAGFLGVQTSPTLKVKNVSPYLNYWTFLHFFTIPVLSYCSPVTHPTTLKPPPPSQTQTLSLATTPFSHLLYTLEKRNNEYFPNNIYGKNFLNLKRLTTNDQNSV